MAYALKNIVLCMLEILNWIWVNMDQLNMILASGHTRSIGRYDGRSQWSPGGTES